MIANMFLCSSGAVCAADRIEAAAEAPERTPRKGPMGAVIIAKVESIESLSIEEAAESRRRIELVLIIESQVGLSGEKKKMRIRCNGISRIFGAKNDEITGKVFLFRILENFVDPYDGKFETWVILGGHP